MQEEISKRFREVIGEPSHFPSLRRIAGLAWEALPKTDDKDSRDSAIWRLILKMEIGDERLLKLWKHGFYCGKICEMMAPRVGLPEESAFCSGLLHDIGKVILCISNPAAFYRTVQLFEYYEGRISTSFAEKQTLGIDHGEIGAAAASQCGIPEKLSKIIHRHHAPRSVKSAESDVPMTELVYIADIIAWNLGYPSINGKNPYLKDQAQQIYDSDLQALGIDKNGLKNWVGEAGRIIAEGELFLRKII